MNFALRRWIVLGAFLVRLHAQTTAREYPAPGQLIDLGGRKLHLFCQGSGSPTVVLAAGGGAYSIDWALVQPRVAGQTRTCSFDRAGLGWSDPGPADETVKQTIGDLNRALRIAGERGPYVLVGASIGGIYILAYQRAFPDEVVGLVFTNSANRVGFLAKGKGGLLWELSEEDLRSGFPLPVSSRGPKPVHEGEPFDRLPENLQAVRLWLDVRLWERTDPAKAVPDSLLSWRQEFLKLFEETDEGHKPALGNLPVVVIASAPAGTNTDRLKREGAGARLDFLSSRSIHITATGSGHEIHLYQPDRVVEGILELIRDLRPARCRRAPRARDAAAWLYGTIREMKVPQFARTVRGVPGMYSTPVQMDPSASATAAV
ncbi:MAG TPA: alpha/beta hydrolase [Bryobacteraceae bacterium]|jgi:pimeloyl-ACP methyl ester carboxylesterase